jgi:hypothetical protein
VATPVPRKQTMAGGFEIDLSDLPGKPSGRTGVSGELLKPEMADARREAFRLYFELQHAIATIGEELHGDRFVVADERLKFMLGRVADCRRYVEALAKQNLKPYVCPRCQTAGTDDQHGDRLCASCIPMAYGKTELR